MSSTTITLASATIIPCDDRCMFAKHEDCDCQCGGANHQRGNMLTAEQRKVQRTEAGRRVALFAPATPAWDVAWAMQEMEDEGETRKDIAAAFGVSQPVVRRTLRSLQATLATAEARTA